jgi:ABC-type transport system involved in cytochrome c biogenesis permease component
MRARCCVCNTGIAAIMTAAAMSNALAPPTAMRPCYWAATSAVPCRLRLKAVLTRETSFSADVIDGMLEHWQADLANMSIAHETT